MRTPFASYTGAPAPRVAWLALIEKAAAVADRAAQGETLSDDERRELAHLLARTGAVRFPLPYASATDAAGGLTRLTRGFLDSSLPEVRQALGRAVAMAARCCQRLLDLDDEAAAAAFQAAQARRLGEGG